MTAQFSRVFRSAADHSPCEQWLRLSQQWHHCEYFEQCKHNLWACETFQQFVRDGMTVDRPRTDKPSKWRYEAMCRDDDEVRIERERRRKSARGVAA